jgi:hypothetical protein
MSDRDDEETTPDERDDEHGVDEGDLGDSDRTFLADIFRQISLNGQAAVASTTTARTCPILHGKPLRMESVAELLRTGAVRRVVVLTGAGVSVAAGIPDFRTPGTGLYDNLQKYNLPFPEAIFEMDFFRSNPKPFFLCGQRRCLEKPRFFNAFSLISIVLVLIFDF